MTRLFLLAGQSNMVGQGVTVELPAAQYEAPANVRLFEDGQWRELLWRDRFGPEVGFAAEFAAALPEDRISLCKVARGGANLCYDWNPDGESRGEEDAYRGPLYPKLIEAFETVVAGLKSEGDSWELSGMLWMQGERDCVFEHMAYAYGTNLAALIETVRRDTRAEALPVLVGQVAPRSYDLTAGKFRHAYRRIVQKAQREVSRQVSGVSLVETVDLPQSDNLHYDTGGQLELGKRFAHAYLDSFGRTSEA